MNPLRERLPRGVNCDPPPIGERFVPLVIRLWLGPEEPVPPPLPDLLLDFGLTNESGTFVWLTLLPPGAFTVPTVRSDWLITAPPDEGLPADDPTPDPTELLLPELETAHGTFTPPDVPVGGETEERRPEEESPEMPPPTGVLRPASGGRNVLIPCEEPLEEELRGADTAALGVESGRLGFGMFSPDGRFRPAPPVLDGAGLTAVTGDFEDPNELGADLEPPESGLRKELPPEGRNSDEPDLLEEPPLDRPLLKLPERDDPMLDPRELEKLLLEPLWLLDELKPLPEDDE